MTILAIIPARAGSKGIPNKNLALCWGVPLIEWTLDVALDSSVDEVVVSSDSGDIINMCTAKGVRWHPAEHISDEAQIEDRLPDVFGVNPDIIVLLQPTSPVRTSKMIDDAVEQLQRDGADSLVSVVESHAFIWNQHAKLYPNMSPVQISPAAMNYKYQHRPRRQDMELQYEENGSIYVFTREHWERTHNRLGGKISLFVMPEETAIQVDSPYDLWLAGVILERQHTLILGNNW